MARPARLREAHAHIYSHGQAMRSLRLESARSAEDVLAKVAAKVEAMRAGDKRAWLIGGGARVEGWATPAWPTLGELDRACPDRPCALWSFDSHALMANSRALEAAGIAEGSPVPANGRIVRDGAGNLTGLLLEQAALDLWGAMPEPGMDERRACVRDALNDLREHGFVEVHDMKSQAWLGPVLANLSDAGELPARVWLYAPHDRVIEFDSEADDWQREDVLLAGGKLFADGTLNSRTAWVLEGYADPLPGMPTGQAMYGTEQIAGAIRTCRELGLGLAVHAIGDGAVRAVLDAYESCDPDPTDVDDVGMPTLRIEHAELIDRKDVPRFGQMGVVASVQPCHLLTDIEALRRSLPHRLDRVFPLRELIDAGCRPGELMWFGSDTPIVRPHPEDALQAAVERRRKGMAEGEAIGLGQRLKAAELWRGYVPGED